MYKSHLKRTMLAALTAGALAMTGLAAAQAPSTQPMQPGTSATTPMQPSTTSPGSSMSGMSEMMPGKTESAQSAFQKLDATNSGYVSREAASKLSGFDSAFTNADKDKDGRLTQDEFGAAWSAYGANAR